MTVIVHEPDELPEPRLFRFLVADARAAWLWLDRWLLTGRAWRFLTGSIGRRPARRAASDILT